MHKYLRAIGFSKLNTRKEIQELIKSIIIEAGERQFARKDENSVLVEFDKDFADNLGIAVCGEFDENDTYYFNYYYPYLRSSHISSEEDVSVERHAACDAYSGICEDMKVGVSLIFYLQNMITYLKYQRRGKIPARGTSVSLSALSLQGTVMMPIKKDEMQLKQSRKESQTRSQLIQAARNGDEDAIESLTLEDMDMYTSIPKRIRKDDGFTLVDTYFMPFGSESDHYSVLGEITACRKVTNKVTGEEIYLMTIDCNELTIDLCINIIDLLGEPQIGRRFKGNIWLQGNINFPE